MKKSKKYKVKTINEGSLNEPIVPFNEAIQIKVFNSFEEQSEFEMQQLSQLSGIEILAQLRKFINLAYAMHGYYPENLPKKHSIKIISGEYL